MTLPRLSLLLALVGGGLVLAGVLVGSASVSGVEGAYFSRPVVTGIYRVSGSGLSLFSPSDGNLWLGAGVALLVAAAGTLFAHRAGMRLVRPQG